MLPAIVTCSSHVVNHFIQPSTKTAHGKTNMAGDTKPRTFNPPGVPLPPPTYNHVCVTPLIPGLVDLVTLAGLTGFSPSDDSSPKTIKEQAPIAYSKIKICLAAAGATPRDIVQVRHYIVNETGDPAVDKLDVVERGWGDAWVSLHWPLMLLQIYIEKIRCSCVNFLCLRLNLWIGRQEDTGHRTQLWVWLL
jgi:enamine deaminase RidA (YjgF/YER057c/UK114 family)